LEAKENTVVQMELTIHLASFQQLLEQHDHQQLDQSLNAVTEHLTQLIQIAVSMQGEKENTVAQMELTILNVNFQRPQEQLNHQRQLDQDLSVQMELLILLIQIAVSTQEEKENIAAQMEPIIQPASLQQLLEQHNHQRLEHYQRQLDQDQSVQTELLTQLIQIAVSTQEEKGNTAVQMEQTILNVSFQQQLGQSLQQPSELPHQLQNQRIFHLKQQDQ
jgi:hypothetical protein